MIKKRYLWQILIRIIANELLSHVAILSTMFLFEDSLNCIVKHYPACQEFFEVRDKSLLLRVSKKSSRSTSGGPIGVPPFVSSLTKPCFSMVSLQKVTFPDPDNILIGFRPHQLELVGLCAPYGLKNHVYRRSWASIERGSYLSSLPDNYLRNELV